MYKTLNKQGTIISDGKLLELTMRLIDELTAVAMMPNAHSTKAMFDICWLILSMMIDVNASAVIKKFHEAMTTEAVRVRICTFDTLGLSFTSAIVSLLDWLHKSNIGNWDELAVKITTSYLQLNSSIFQRQEAQDKNKLVQSFYINNANLTTRVLKRFAELLNPSEPAGILEMIGLSSTASRKATLRVAVLKATKEVGEQEDKLEVNVHSLLNPILAGVLASITIVYNQFDSHAQKILTQQVCKRYYMLLNSDANSEIVTLTMSVFHTASCLWLGTKTADATAKFLTERELKWYKDTIASFFMDTMLADKLLFSVGSDEKVVVQSEFIGSTAIINHPSIFKGNRQLLSGQIKLLELHNDEELINRLFEHSKRIASLLNNAFQHSSRSSKGIVDLTRSSFVDVVGFITLGTPLNERQPMNITTARKFLSTIESYFPSFGYTNLPPLPALPQQGGSNTSQQDYQIKYRQAVARRQHFLTMQKTTKVLVGILELKWSPHYSKELLSGIIEAENKMKTVGGAYQTMILCYRLFLLRLAAKFVESGNLSYHIPDLMRFIKIHEGKLYPDVVVTAAHDLIVKVIKIPSLMSALSFCKYIQECIPVRPLSDGRMTVDVRFLPHRLLLREFTKNIRAVCQKIEKWDFNFVSAAKSARVNDNVFHSIQKSDHPSGVGLVLYVVESLRITCLSLHKRRGMNNYRKLYVHSLVNLLQCLHTAVLTQVCVSLESVFSSLTDIQEITFWLSYTSKAIKESHNPSTKQQVVAWFLILQSRLSPEKLGIRAKL